MDYISPHGRSDEVSRKVDLVRDWLERTGLPGVVLTTSGGVAWLSGGTTNPIERGSRESPLWLVVTPKSLGAITTAVEFPRLRAEA